MSTPSTNWSDLLNADHETTQRVFDAFDRVLSAPELPSTQVVSDALEYFTEYVERCHALKEETHLFPLLIQRGMPEFGGPLAVMLDEHERSAEALCQLRDAAAEYASGRQEALAEIKKHFRQYSGILKEHFWKETDILFPMAHRLFAPEDHQTVRSGIAAVEASIGPDTRLRFYKLAQRIVEHSALRDLCENLSPQVLAAMLNTLPIELSFVDADDRVRYFSHEHQQKIFPRGRGAIGRAVQMCHPQKSVDRVNAVLRSLKSGERDVAEFWLDFRDRKVHVRYFAVRAADGSYIGTLETVQDITDIQKIGGQRRLVDEALTANA